MNKKRFVEITDCIFWSSLFTKEFNDIYQKIKFAKWNYLKWKDLTLMKDPMTLSIYLQLLQDLKPKTILEFGTYEGGSALWMHDIMISLNLECKIHTFDINSEKVRLPNLESLIFHHLDNLHIIEYVKENYKLFSSLERPVLVIEDSHINVIELLQTIDSFIDNLDANGQTEVLVDGRKVIISASETPLFATAHDEDGFVVQNSRALRFAWHANQPKDQLLNP